MKASFALENTPGMGPGLALAGAEPADIGIPMLLELFDGDRPAVAELLEAARRSIDTDLLRIERGAAENNASDVAEAAHRLKGTSGSISAQRLHQVSSSVERAARQECSTAVPPLLAELRAAGSVTAGAILRFSLASGPSEHTNAR